MGIGDNAELGLRSTLSTMTETTYGTPETTGVATNFVEFKSCSLTQKFEKTKATGINTTRSYTRMFKLNQTVDGTVELDLHPEDGISFFIHALGGALTVSVGSAGVFTHTIAVGNDLLPQGAATQTSLTIDNRKGPTRSMRYVGCRVNSMTIKGEIGQPITASYDIVGKSATIGASAADTVVGFSTVRPFLFTDGAFRYAGTAASITSTATESIIGFELNLNNNLISDDTTRAIGSDSIAVLPAGMRDVSLKLTMRNDTTAVYDRFLAHTQGAVEINLDGPSVSSDINHSLTLTMGKVFYGNGDIEVSGADVLVVEPEIMALRSSEDPTTTATDFTAVLVNGVSAY